MIAELITPVLLHSEGLAWDEYLLFGSLGVVVLGLFLLPRLGRRGKGRKKTRKRRGKPKES